MSALTYATAQILRVLPRRRISHAVGRLAEHSWHPRLGHAVVGLYSRFYDVHFDECREHDGFRNFDAFFTRELKPGARPVAGDPHALVSPADGRLDWCGRVEPRARFKVKGRLYGVEDLIGDAGDAARYVGGGACIVYLSPRDYHRVHAPADGTIRVIRSMPGDYFPVNDVGMRHVKHLLARNRRVAIVIDTERLGRITVVMVAAFVVGRISTPWVDAPDVPLGEHPVEKRVKRGDQIGVFHLGSTAVVFVEACAYGPWAREGGSVRYGEAILAAREGAP